MADVSTILKSIVNGGADAVLAGYGMSRTFVEELKGTGLILRVDGGNSELSSFQTGNRILDSEDALIEGADCLACMGFPGAVNEVDTLINVSELAAEAHAWGLPVLAEMLPGGFGPEPAKTVETVATPTTQESASNNVEPASASIEKSEAVEELVPTEAVENTVAQ